VKSKEVPVKGPALATTKATSIVMVNTGDGKGKSTAAFGTAMRGAARGWKVSVIQFVKSGKWKVGEEKAATSLGIEWLTIGDGFTWDSKNMDRTEAIARHAWAVAKEKIQSGDYGLVVLDEITYPMNWGWIPTSEVVEVIRNRPPSVNVIATGRDAPAELVEVADTVTEMRKVKHAFDRGIRAIRGLDF
jgi:cob(I)alamin adenosyltransferase